MGRGEAGRGRWGKGGAWVMARAVGAPRLHRSAMVMCIGILVTALGVAEAREDQVKADAAEWREVAGWVTARGDVVAEFEERRVFPFRKGAVVLKGEVRVSRERGLSLRYVAPEERVVILDEKGVLVRDARGQQAPPDKRAEAGQRAFLHVLRMDFGALEKEFEVFGERKGETWTLALVPRDEGLRRAIGDVLVDGERAEVKRIELRRSERQRIEIVMSGARAAEFSAEEAKRYFR